MFESRHLRRAALAAAVVLFSLPETAHAASCKSTVRSIGARSPSESTAQWLASARWEYKVRKLYGTAYDNWDKAKNARFFCRETGLTNIHGRHVHICEATARPCKS